MWEYRHTDELYHYGVPGMKWGHRKNRAVVSARNAYKQANKDLRKARTSHLFKASTWVAGRDNGRAADRRRAQIKKLTNEREKAAFKAIDAQAKAAYDKKLAKTGDKNKAEKASMKVHSKAMSKDTHGSGLPGSIADAKTGGNTRYYDHLKATKGKAYANKIEKKYKNKTVAALAGSVVLAGAGFVMSYMNS